MKVYSGNLQHSSLGDTSLDVHVGVGREASFIATVPSSQGGIMFNYDPLGRLTTIYHGTSEGGKSLVEVGNYTGGGDENISIRLFLLLIF
jgi:hypothetical protein